MWRRHQTTVKARRLQLAYVAWRHMYTCSQAYVCGASPITKHAAIAKRSGTAEVCRADGHVIVDSVNTSTTGDGRRHRPHIWKQIQMVSIKRSVQMMVCHYTKSGKRQKRDVPDADKGVQDQKRQQIRYACNTCRRNDVAVRIYNICRGAGRSRAGGCPRLGK